MGNKKICQKNYLLYYYFYKIFLKIIHKLIPLRYQLTFQKKDDRFKL